MRKENYREKQSTPKR